MTDDIPEGIYEITPSGLTRVGDSLPLKDIERPLSRGHCPDCLATDWRPGPRGGASRNIECRNCLARFNVTFFMGQLIFCERIPKEGDGGTHWREDMFPS